MEATKSTTQVSNSSESMRGSRNFFQRGSKSDVFFVCFNLIDEGKEDPNTTKSGPSLNGVSLVGR